jgi:hypothetical protein
MKSLPNSLAQDLSMATPLLWNQGLDYKKGDNRITACEMKFMRRMAGYMKWDHKKNDGILKELRIQKVTDYEYIKHYQENWRRRG